MLFIDPNETRQPSLLTKQSNQMTFLLDRKESRDKLLELRNQKYDKLEKLVIIRINLYDKPVLYQQILRDSFPNGINILGLNFK